MLGSTVSTGIATGTTIWSLSQADVTFLGESSGNQSGRSVASAGDLDDDGRDDLLIGAPLGGGGTTYLLLSPY